MPLTPSALDPRVRDVTERIRERSRDTRAAYLERLQGQARGPARTRLSCTNLAHGFAASGGDKDALKGLRWPNLGIVTAYNDMLSAHQPYERFPGLIRQAARDAQATAQVAGGVPAMCDGVTQGQPGMELSLFSREVIAMSTGIALSHGMFDAALYLGVCDKIVPGLLIGALAFGQLPAVFVPAGPMPSGLPNKEKARLRQQFDLEAPTILIVLDRLDLIELAHEVVEGIDLPRIIRESTGSVASEGISSVRIRSMEADRAVTHFVDRVLFRRTRPAGPEPSADGSGPAGPVARWDGDSPVDGGRP